MQNEIFEKTKETNKQVVIQTLGFISSAFVLVAALAWNETIKSTINRYFQSGSNLISQFIYAIIVTIIAVLLTSKLNKLAEKLKGQDKPKE